MGLEVVSSTNLKSLDNDCKGGLDEVGDWWETCVKVECADDCLDTWNYTETLSIYDYNEYDVLYVV